MLHDWDQAAFLAFYIYNPQIAKQSDRRSFKQLHPLRKGGSNGVALTPENIHILKVFAKT